MLKEKFIEVACFKIKYCCIKIICLVYGTKYPLQKFLELDPDEIIRSTHLLKPDIDIILQCVSNSFYSCSKRQLSGQFQI